MIVDTHVHIFPFLGDACGYPSAQEHMEILQFFTALHSNPVRRSRDHVIVENHRPASRLTLSPDQLPDVNFRVGRFGRLEWTLEGEDYYLSFYPPSLQSVESPPEFMVQQMVHAGVDRAVLHNDPLYGRLDDFFAHAVRRFPDRFVGLASVDAVGASSREEIERVRCSVKELGMRGVYYLNRSLFFEGYRRFFDDESFEPFWEEVRSLGVPIFWELEPVPEPTEENLLKEVDRLNRWAERHPDMPCLYTHGFNPRLLEGNLPEPIERLFSNEQFMVEIVYPVSWGRNHEYPFPELRPTLRRVYNAVGADRLVWGSDMPNVERNCTYRQSLEYLRPCMDFASSSEIDRILGANALRLLGER